MTCMDDTHRNVLGVNQGLACQQLLDAVAMCNSLLLLGCPASPFTHPTLI